MCNKGSDKTAKTRGYLKSIAKEGIKGIRDRLGKDFQNLTSTKLRATFILKVLKLSLLQKFVIQSLDSITLKWAH